MCNYTVAHVNHNKIPNTEENYYDSDAMVISPAYFLCLGSSLGCGYDIFQGEGIYYRGMFNGKSTLVYPTGT